jgi:long-chain acyl-CoA synthetase
MDKKTFRCLLDEHNVPDDHEAFGFLGKKYLTYGDVKSEIVKIKTFMVQAGIVQGDKVALLSANQPNWGVVYLAVTSYGAIIVPLLPDFGVKQIDNILKHSETRMIFLSEKQNVKLKSLEISYPVFSLDTLSLISGDLDETKSFEGDTYSIEEDDLAAILYTSGTTGNSKGVMLTHKNLLSNVDACYDVIPISTKDRFLSILPLAHTYECTVGLLFAFSRGSTTTYIEGAPTPRILMGALAKVKPTLVLSVPLLIEKIYRGNVAASINSKKITALLYKMKPFRKLLNKVAGKKLLQAFGGELRFFGIGGAPLAPEVETFLHDSHFPYSIGYGLTETAPLLAGDFPSLQVYRSTGNCVSNAQLRIDSPNPETGVGEIQAKGPNVMKGYYKDPDRTAEVFTEDGWFKTGDLGTINKEGKLFIRGREKNLILGSNGENIYPEEIESILNENEYVAESIIMEMGKELVAMIYLNADKLAQEIKHLKLPIQKVDEYKTMILEKIRKEANNHLNIQSRLSKMIEHHSPFEKTPSLKIKRFLYHKKK